jgi:hypothetical protein
LSARKQSDIPPCPPIIFPPENKRRLGRAPSDIRENLKELAYESSILLEALLKEDKITPTERFRLIDMIVKHGLGQKIEYVVSNIEVFEIVGEVAAKHMNPETYRAFRGELEERFRDS